MPTTLPGSRWATVSGTSYCGRARQRPARAADRAAASGPGGDAGPPRPTSSSRAPTAAIDACASLAAPEPPASATAARARRRNRGAALTCDGVRGCCAVASSALTAVLLARGLAGPGPARRQRRGRLRLPLSRRLAERIGTDRARLGQLRRGQRLLRRRVGDAGRAGARRSLRRRCSATSAAPRRSGSAGRSSRGHLLALHRRCVATTSPKATSACSRERWAPALHFAPDYFGRHVTTVYAEVDGHTLLDERFRLFGARRRDRRAIGGDGGGESRAAPTCASASAGRWRGLDLQIAWIARHRGRAVSGRLRPASQRLGRRAPRTRSDARASRVGDETAGRETRHSPSTHHKEKAMEATRSIRAWLVACAGALALVACGGGDGDTTAMSRRPWSPMPPACSNPYGGSTCTSIRTWSTPGASPSTRQGFVWVANAGTSTSTLYDGSGVPQSLVVAIPDGAGRRGRAHRASSSIACRASTSPRTASTGASAFIFAGEDGTIAGWSPTVNRTNAVTGGRRLRRGRDLQGPGARAPRRRRLPLRDRLPQRHGRRLRRQLRPGHARRGAFTDPNLPAGYAPFGIQAIGNQLYVSLRQAGRRRRGRRQPAPGSVRRRVRHGGPLVKRLSPPAAS